MGCWVQITVFITMFVGMLSCFLESFRAHFDIYSLTNVFSWGMGSGHLQRGRRRLRLVRLMGWLRSHQQQLCMLLLRYVFVIHLLHWLKLFRHASLYLPVRSGGLKMGNLFCKTFTMQYWSFLMKKKMNGLWKLWHGGTGILPVYLLICMTTFCTGKFFLTNPVWTTNEQKTTILTQTPTVFNQRPNMHCYRGLRNDDDRLPTNKNSAMQCIHQCFFSFMQVVSITASTQVVFCLS